MNASGVPDPASPVRLPDPTRLFAARAARLAGLADGHAASSFLRFLSRLAAGQEVAVREVRIPPGPAADAARPLEHDRLPRGAAWRAMLRVILSAARPLELPVPARAAVARLDAAGEAELEELAERLLAGEPIDPAAAPFVGAALQAEFTVLAAGLDAARLAPPVDEACPACGFAPVAAMIGGVDRLRYVTCALCATAWHVPRVHCAVCRSAAGIAYFEVEGAPAGARAESCPSCRAYLKVFDEEKIAGAEPLADDAASLVLDVLLGEEGWRRAGRNLLAPAGEPA